MRHVGGWPLKPPNEEPRPPEGDGPEQRRRQFESERGLTERPALPLESDEDDAIAPEPPPEEEKESLEGQHPDEADLDLGGDAQ